VQSQAKIPTRLYFSKISLTDAGWVDEAARSATAAAIANMIDLVQLNRTLLIGIASVVYIAAATASSSMANRSGIHTAAWNGFTKFCREQKIAREKSRFVVLQSNCPI
jgi:hypothetical protein